MMLIQLLMPLYPQVSYKLFTNIFILDGPGTAGILGTAGNATYD